MRIQTDIAFIIAVVLAACAPVSTPTPQPSSNVSLTPTLAAKLERWLEYENALAAAFLPAPYLSGKGLCEWEILGQSAREVYVWAMCQVADSAEGTAMSAPAVIFLAENDRIEKVDVPGDGSQYAVDIRAMFPPELQAKILSQSLDSLDDMWLHIQSRHTQPEPPLIVRAGIPLP